MSFGEGLLIPVLSAFILGRFFGSKGVMASIAITKVLLGVIVFLIVCIRCRRFPNSWEDFMFLPEDFGGKESDTRDGILLNMDDVMRESRMAEQFCLEHGSDTVKSHWMALFMEEMAGNIVQHAKPFGTDAICVEYRLFASKDGFCLCLRDYCEAFDPNEYYKIHKESSPEENIGIRMVMGHAREARYYNTFNSNNLLLYL